MQKILLLLLLSISAVTVLTAQLDLDDLQVLWDLWKLEHHKSYTNKVEERARFAIFIDNYKKVTDYNHKNNGLKLVLNIFADLTLDEFTTYNTGTYRANSDVFDLDTTNIVDYSGFIPPDSVDWRLAGAVTAVHSQKKCGSSWAWPVVGALEALNFIATGTLIPFSTQQLIDCDEGNQGCEGGWYNRAFNYTAINGILPEAENLYQGSQDTCKYNESKAIKVNSGYAYVQPKSTEALKASVAIQPVVVSVQSDALVFQFYRSGVIKYDCGAETDHGVLITGYTTIDGQEAFIIKNSLGAAWGDHGFAYISTDQSINDGHGACGILSRPVVPSF